uniref:Uncharacterized protein n=1 Tax=Tanacetum cinerariifolium TaxID=118510 RepID=A0A6L2MI67_TANCI|nr:hypothetical protein [Tanacetum cinerariifolium]
MNGLYARRMILKPCDLDREVLVNETFHEKTDEKLTEKELKQVEADDQAFQTILLGLPENMNGNAVAARAEAPAWYLDEIEEVNANCILMANLHQALTSGTQTDNTFIYDSDRSVEVYEYNNCYDNEILNMFTKEEQHTELLEPISKPHQAQQNDSNVIFVVFSVKQASKFVRDFKSLAKEANESLSKYKTLEFEIARLLRAVVNRDIMSIVQSNSVVDASNIQTELDRTKKLENYIIKKEKDYVVLWNNWYIKCKEYKYDKISYDKAYNDMQQKIEQLQA